MRRVRQPVRDVTHRWHLKFRLRDAILRCCVPAVFAAVGGVPGVDLNPVRPASSALARRIETNWPQPASLILLLSPDFARPVG